ncbi:MAG: hypothetical protein RDV48_12145 [Candidatus Eremiobacteraeota bacterium]|nr:hypothetical protein [Candidatus Eremiobacteraeota bacterium]
MAYLLSFAVILVLFLMLLFSAVKATGGIQAREVPCRASLAFEAPSRAEPSQGTAESALTRKELEERLTRLKDSPPPQKCQMGAMCYAPRLEPKSVQYTCPACGAKTVYAAGTLPGFTVNQAEWLVKNAGLMRRSVKDITELSVTLDESQLCRKCSPKVSEPHLYLVVKYKGGSARTKDATNGDVRLIQEFLEGKDRHKGFQDEETSLKDHLQRLRILLGIDLK